MVDAWQGRGVGRRLLTAIVEEAARIGVSRVHARVLTGNAAALALVRAVFPCLLYTSPSPRDKRQSRMPSSA